MSMQRVPRAVFSLERLAGQRARREIAEGFAQHLSNRLGPVSLFEIAMIPVTTLMLKIAGGDYVVAIQRLKRKGSPTDAWKVSIDSRDYPLRFRRMPNDEQRKLARELMLISDEVNTLLVNIPGITRLRWFFEGWTAKIPGVRTPSELPWHVDVPELGDAQNRDAVNSASLARSSQRWHLMVRAVGLFLVTNRWFGLMIAAVGILLSVHFLAALIDGESPSSLWRSGTIGATCIIVGGGLALFLTPLYKTYAPKGQMKG